MSLIYLDYAAATPIDERVLAAMRPYFSDEFYNPSASYLAARSARAALENARAGVAGVLGAKPGEIIFTAGATEANNLAIHGVMLQASAILANFELFASSARHRITDTAHSAPRQESPKYAQTRKSSTPGVTPNVVVSAIEHESVLAPAGDYDCRLAPVTSEGRIDLKKLSQAVDSETALVAVMYANNEIGTIEPLKEVAKIVAAQRASRRASGNKLPIYLLSDAAQAANYLDLHVSRLGVDLMSLNGGKIYGPKQSGCLFIKTGVALKPLISGGGQERGLRSGTENVAAAVGFSKALELAQSDRAHESARLSELQSYFFSELARLIPSAAVNGNMRWRLPNNLHFTLPGQDNERLIFALDEAGIMAAAGSACSASDEQSSHVLAALGLGDAEARASLRLSLGRATTKAQLERCLKTLVKLVA